MYMYCIYILICRSRSVHKKRGACAKCLLCCLFIVVGYSSGLVGVVNEKDKQLSATKHIQFLPMLGKTESSSSSSTNHPQNVVPGNPQGTTFPEGLLPPGTQNENIAVAKNAGEEKIGENIAAKSDENVEEVSKIK